MRWWGPAFRNTAQVYETGLREGGILIGVEAETKEDIENLERLLDDVGGARTH